MAHMDCRRLKDFADTLESCLSPNRGRLSYRGVGPGHLFGQRLSGRDLSGSRVCPTVLLHTPACR